MLDCYHRSGSVESLRRYEWSSEDSQKVVEGTGLSHLAGCMMQHLDTTLITAFVERWQPDTNTFHMPFGEISILLHDVHHILRIPVEGELMRDDPHPDVLKLDMHDLFRVPVDGPVGGKWKLKWFLNGVIHAEGLLVRGREMKIRDLEAWIYEYFPLFRPSQILQAADAPRASSWVCHRFAGGDDARQRLVRYRQMLDEMSGEDVSWTLYGRDAGTEVLRSLYTGVIRFADVAEGYDPSRCRRQFGY
ncbi:unnamed protein product [Linum tenue]|uniref:Aminotransferase-like plant mobile domain-containing protein n=1 Tax=Linum tenue TaxID=586396 RepID=A0AAV0L9E8_9ROSI|nr:unnamed protein product [Linum tenue]